MKYKIFAVIADYKSFLLRRRASVFVAYVMCIFAIVFSAQHSLAQHCVKGQATAGGEVLEGALVRLLTTDSVAIRQTLTDSAGIYSIDGLSITQGIIACSAIGYKDAFVPFKVIADSCVTVNLALAEDSRMLSEVVVKSAPVIRAEKGHIVAFPSKEQKKHSFGGYDLLSNMMIPGLGVDRSSGEVSALFTKATLYVNGIKATPQEVRALRANDVMKVEYHDMPTGAYAGETAVVNFVVKTYKSGGFIEADAEQKVGYADGRYSIAGKAAMNNTTLQVFGGYGYSKTYTDRKSGFDRYDFGADAMCEHYTSLGGNTRNGSAYGQADLTHTLGQHVLQMAVFYNRDNNPYSESSERVEYVRAEDALLAVDRKSRSSNLGQQIGTRLNGKFILRGGQTVEAYARLAHADNKNAYSLDETGSDGTMADIDNSSREKQWTLDATMSYSKVFKRGNSLTVKFTDLYKHSNADYSGTNIHRSSLWSNEELVFVQYMHPLSRKVNLMFQPGISALQYSQSGRETTSLFSPRLGMRLTAALPRSQFLMVMGNVGNSFPTLAGMSTAEQTVNRWHVIRGNPDIDNTKMYQLISVYGLNTSSIGLQVMAMYRYDHSVPVSSFEADGQRIIESWTTNANGNTLNTNLSLTYRPLQQLHLQLSGGYNLYAFNGYQSLSVGSPQASLNANFYAGAFMIRAHVATPQRVMGMDLSRATIPWNYGLQVSYVVNQWKFEAGIDNPFMKHGKYKFKSFNPVYNRHYSLISRKAGCYGFVKVAYNINFGKKVNADDLKPEDIKIENALLKVN